MTRIADYQWIATVAAIVFFGTAVGVAIHYRSGGLFRKSSVRTISTRELQDLLEPHSSAGTDAISTMPSLPSLSSADFVLVDVRSDAETNVSVIPGAITQKSFEENADQHAEKLVVAYCTVGVRSGDYAKRLSDQGWTVRNYEGSILQWVRAGLPLVTLNGKPTRQVHSYSDQYSVPDGYEQVVQ